MKRQAKQKSEIISLCCLLLPFRLQSWHVMGLQFKENKQGWQFLGTYTVAFYLHVKCLMWEFWCCNCLVEKVEEDNKYNWLYSWCVLCVHQTWNNRKHAEGNEESSSLTIFRLEVSMLKLCGHKQTWHFK